MKIKIKKDTIKKEVKSIKKSSNLSHTQVYQMLLSILGFESIEEYEKTSKRTIYFKLLNELSFEELAQLEEKIKKQFNNVEKVYFIEKTRSVKNNYYFEMEEGLMLKDELLIQPYIYNLKTEYKAFYFIDENYYIRENRAYEYIDLLERRFKDSGISQNLYSRILNNAFVSDKETESLNKFIELKRFVNKTKANNAEDFLAPLLYEYLFNRDDFGIYYFYIEIKKRIDLEKKYMKNLVKQNAVEEHGLSHLVLDIPKLTKRSLSDDSLIKMNAIKKAKGNDTSIILGETGRFLKKTITISNKENLYIRTGTSSLGEYSLSELLFQHALNGSGFMHFNFMGDTSSYLKILSKVKCINSSESVYFFNENNIESLSKQMVKSFVYNKKKIVLTFPPLEKTEFNYGSYLIKKVCEIISWVNEFENKNKEPYVMSFYDTDYLGEKFNNLLVEKIDQLNENNISILIADWSLSYDLRNGKKSLIDKINKKILMKNYDFPKSLESFGVFDFKKEFDFSSFIYGEGTVFDEENVYKMSFFQDTPSEILLKLPLNYK